MQQTGMQQTACATINESVTAFVESPHGRALAQRAMRGELTHGEFFSAACAAAEPAARTQLAEGIPKLPQNLERAFLQAWSLADRTSRRIELDWQLGEPAPGLEVRYGLEVAGEAVRFSVRAVAEAPVEADTP